MEEWGGKRNRLGRGEGERPNRRRETVRGVEARALSWTGSERSRERTHVQTQDSGEVVGETLAAAEGRGGGSRWEGHTRCSCRETSGDSRGRKGLSNERNPGSRNARGGKRRQGHRRRRVAGGGIRQHPPGHFGDRRPVGLAVCGLVQEGGVPTWGEVGSGRAIAGLRREEDGGIGAEDLADPEVRVQELAACQIQAIVGGTGAVGGGVRQHRVRGGILEREERIGKVIKGVRDTSGASARDKDSVAAIMGERRRDVEGPDTVVRPRLAL